MKSKKQQRYAYRPGLMETFVDTERFAGTCYRAANWRYIGQTKGRGKLGPAGKCSVPIKILGSREYGASYAILAIARQLGLDQVLYSRPEPWVSSALAMIVGRLVYAGSKLSLCNHHPNSCLWELCGIEEAPDVDVPCYEPMDKLLQRQGAIQRTLARRHLNGGHLVLYDITSVYFEGAYKQSKLVTRDSMDAISSVMM